MKNLNEKGNVVIILTLMITVIFGFTAFVIDIGLVYVEKARLTNALDSAALAAALDLPQNPTTAKDTAVQYLQNNNLDPSKAVISISSDNMSIEIDDSTTVNHIFAPIIGINSSNVKAVSKAAAAPAGSVSEGIRPFAVQAYNFSYGDLVTLKQDAGSSYNGNFGAVALGGTGASVFLNNSLYGYCGSLSVGDYISTEPGNMEGEVNIINNYINSEQSTFDNFQRNSIRVWTLPLVNTLDVCGRSQIQIVGFAEFYVEGVTKKSSQIQIDGRFIRYVVNGTVNTTLNDTGAYAERLVQ